MGSGVPRGLTFKRYETPFMLRLDRNMEEVEVMKKWVVLIIIFVMVLLAGCSGDKGKDGRNAGEYNIYYLDSKTSGIVSESYVPSGTTKEELVEELLTMLQKDPEDMVYKKAIPDSVTINEYSFSAEDQLTINFDTSYSQLTGIPEVLCRATVVKTLSQIPGVEYVVFNVNGQPLTDSNGELIILMTDEDFIESTGAETNYKVTLYFANKAGTKLIESSANIIYSGSGSIEERVIGQLINGPTKIGMYDTIPEGTTLLNISTKEGICYVDFNEKFLEAVPDVTGEVTIYSIVNSLVEIPNINKVQFLINGAVVETVRENIPLNGFFERNLDIIETTQ